MPQPKKPNLQPDPVVEALIPDPAQGPPPGTTVLHGYLGKSSTEGVWRLYLDPSLSEYVEIPEADIQHAETLPDTSGSSIWVINTTSLKHVRTETQDVQAEFLGGDITDELLATSPAGVVGGPGGPVPTPPISIAGPCLSRVACPSTVKCPSVQVFCPSQVDACPTRFNCPSVQAFCPSQVDACPTRFKCPSVQAFCPSQVDACPTRFNCPSITDICPTKVNCPSITNICPTKVNCPSITNICPTKVNCPSITNICPSRFGPCVSTAIKCPSVTSVCPTIGITCIPTRFVACPTDPSSCPIPSETFVCPTLGPCPSIAGCPTEGFCDPGGFDPGEQFGGGGVG
jgi:hypothetical protein